MKEFFSEFKKFAVKGNVIDLAVGVIIGASFQSVVTSFTDNILSPVIGIAAKQNFDALFLQVGPVVIKYGAFLNSVVNFLIMSFVVFLFIKSINKLAAIGEKPKEQEPAKRKCPYCYGDLHTEATRCPSCTSLL
ncbi:MAG: large conductance mechanosensitive channel protein MscL [Eubacteriaceae bacterium]|nr:large conductance mechanosensitive channel protein MscL [Eubacteriaceae bacterium]